VFPLLSQCLLLQALCAESDAIEMPGFLGGAKAFEACAKFCYGIAVTVGAHNAVPLRCAAARLGMTEAADRGNLGAKLDAFLTSCLLRRWSDALDVLRATARYAFMPATAPSSASSSSGASWWLPNVAKRPSAWTGWSRWRP